MDLVDLLRGPEGKTLEFKLDLSSPGRALETIVAFANTAGGTLLVGVEDRTRHVRGVADPHDVEERIANLVSDSIAPGLVPDIEILPWRRTQVLAIRVHPSSSRPHYLEREGIESGAYIRVGSTNRRPDTEMLQEVRRVARGTNFYEQPMPDLHSEAHDFRAASESFAAVRPLRERDLESLRLLTDYQGRTVPTVGGVLLFGVDRERHFPDAWIQAGRFAGSDKSRILDRADYSQRGAPIRVSAFDDRLEIENPGLLPFGLTVEDVQRGISKLRNRVIGRVFHALGLIEQWGSGIQRMTAACREAGLPDPDFEEVAIRSRVTIFTHPVSRPTLDDTDQAIVDALSDGSGKLTSEIAAMIRLTPRATRTRLARLVGSGLLREVGTGPQDPKRRYFSASHNH